MSNFSLMFALADVLFLTVKVKDGKIVSLPKKIPMMFGRLEISFKPNIVASRIEEKTIAAIVKVAGDFHLCVLIELAENPDTHFAATDCHLFAYDAAKGTAPPDAILKTGAPISPDTLNAALRPALALTARRFGRGNWEILGTGSHAENLDLGGPAEHP